MTTYDVNSEVAEVAEVAPDTPTPTGTQIADTEVDAEVDAEVAPTDTQSTSATSASGVDGGGGGYPAWQAAAEGSIAAIKRARDSWVAALADSDNIAALAAMATPMPLGDTPPDSWRYDAFGIACQLSGLGEWVENDGQRFYLVNQFWGLRGATPEYRVGYTTTPVRLELSHGRLPDAVRLALGLRTSTGDFRLTAEWLAHCLATRPALAAALKVIVPTSYDVDAWAQVVKQAEVALALQPGGAPIANPYIGTSIAILNDLGVALPLLAEVIKWPPPGLFVWGTATG